MRLLSPRESAAVLAAIQARQPRRVRRGHARVLGDLTSQPPAPGLNGVGYSQQDPNSFPTEGLFYDEQIVFGDPNAVPLASLPNTQGLIDLNTQIAQAQPSTPASTSTSSAPSSFNYNLFPFVATNSPSVQQVLGANTRRQALMVQNQDAANAIFFNLGQGAGLNQGILLNPGFGMLFEIKPPSNFVTVFCPTGNALGVVAEAQ